MALASAAYSTINVTGSTMKLNYKSATILGAALLAASFAMTSQAAPVCVDISAKVTMIQDYSGILTGKVKIGDTVTGSYTYDSATPDTNTFPTVGDYWHTSASAGIILKTGNLVFRTNPDNVNFLVEIVNDHGSPTPVDAYLIRSYNNRFDIGSNTENHISWQLDGAALDAITSTDLPTTAPNLAAFRSDFGLDIQSGSYPDDFLIRSVVNSASLCVVPGKKVTICHHASPKKRQTMVVPQAAVPAHLAHGDELHACTK
jgi:hypothetical protein